MKEKLSESTIKNYHIINNKFNFNKLELDNHEKMIDMITRYSNALSSQKLYLSALLYYIRTNKLDIDTEPYSDKIDELSEKVQKPISQILALVNRFCSKRY